MKNGEAKCKLKGGSAYTDCVVELEWISSDSGSLDSGTLTVLNVDGATTLVFICSLVVKIIKLEQND